ncbi:unnamed protein product [Pleuronectes platessa]|uniref:Lens fiber membrane intrinsic protein n=1 Tax=Pleuronectes platessa TaxID=8262 RepID=A0A9N7VWT1_PLEPL|nr:unnamed protein product [Pleuronectes platessa]
MNNARKQDVPERLREQQTSTALRRRRPRIPEPYTIPQHHHPSPYAPDPPKYYHAVRNSVLKALAAVIVSLMMYSFMGGGLFCAIVGNILLVVSTATDYWMQYRLSGSFAHQGLWRYCMSGKCYMQTDSIAYWNATRAFMILSAMSCFAGIIAGILSFAHFSAFERFNRSFAAGIMFFVSTLFVLLAMAIYTGVTVNFLGKRFGDWRFSWSYILGWVALLMTFFAGIFYMCAYRMHECRRVAGPR